MKLNKKEQEMVEGIDPWYEDGVVVSYTVFLNKGYIFNGEEGACFCEDTMQEVKETLKRVRKVA